MAYRAYKKYNKCKNSEVNNTYKVKNLKNYTSKDNIFIFERPEARYLYVKPKYFQNSLMSAEMQRLKAGGSWQEEIYYDCQTSSREDVVNSTSPSGQNQIKQRHLRMSEVFDKVDNPKEFKGVLKQMARNSNILYHSFRQAYHKTKQSSKSSSDKNHGNKRKYCLKCGGEISSPPDSGQKDRGDMNSLEVQNVDVSCTIRCDECLEEKSKKEQQSDATPNKTVAIDQQRVCSKCNRSFDLDAANQQHITSKYARSFDKDLAIMPSQHTDEQEKLSCVCNYLDTANQQHITSKYTRSFDKDSTIMSRQHANEQEKLSCVCNYLDAPNQQQITPKCARSFDKDLAIMPKQYANEQDKLSCGCNNLDAANQQHITSKYARSFDKDLAIMPRQHADEEDKLSCACNNLDAANQQHITSKYARSFDKDSAIMRRQHADEEDKLSCMCTSFSNLEPAGAQHICSKFTRSVEIQLANQSTTQIASSRWFPPDPPCLAKTNICPQREDELQGLSFCERCAVLRGEIPPPKMIQSDVNSMSSRNVADNASQTYQMKQYSQNTKTEPYQTCQQVETIRDTQQNQANANICPCVTNYNPSQQVKMVKAIETNQPNEKKCSCRTTGNANTVTNKHTLNIRPVYVTIPLKVQIDSPEGDSSFLETEIIMEATSGRQQQNIIPKINVISADKSPADKSPTDKSPVVNRPTDKPSDFKQKKSDVDLFYSCLSASGIIEPLPTSSIENANYVPPPCPMANRTPQIAEITQTAHGIEGTAIISTTITSCPQTSKRDNVRTDMMPMDVNLALIAMPQAKLDDLRTKAERLRAEIVLETKTALEQNGPEQAMVALQEKRHCPQAMDTLSAPIPSQPIVDSKMALERYSPAEAMLHSRGRPPTDDYPLAASLPGSYPAIMPSVSKQQEPIAFDLTPKRESDPSIVLKQNLHPITDEVQTNISTIKPFGHYRRNEMRIQIQEQLNELLNPDSLKNRLKYNTQDREAIIADLHRLFHPKNTGTFPKEITKENVFYDIRYIMEPETQEDDTTPPAPKPTESQESILESLKYILNPKATQKDKAKKRKKYNKETKERILEDLQIILKLRSDLYPDKDERENILRDIRFMLDIGEEMTSPGRPQRAARMQQGPTTSQAMEARQERLQRPMNEIRDSLIGDLRYMLDAPQSGEQQRGPDTSK